MTRKTFIKLFFSLKTYAHYPVLAYFINFNRGQRLFSTVEFFFARHSFFCPVFVIFATLLGAQSVIKGVSVDFEVSKNPTGF